MLHQRKADIGSLNGWSDWAREFRNIDIAK